MLSIIKGQRSLVLLLLTLSTIVASTTSSSQTKGATQSLADKPNIIVILADDLGYGDLSSYGGKIPTPNLDRLAREGLRFTDFHSSGTVCSPTRAGLVTGRYQQRTGVDGVVNADPKHPAYKLGVDPEKEVTYPNLLKAAGYKNALFGKWHLGYKPKFNPMNFGFDRFVGFLSGNIDYISHYDRMENYDWWHNRKQITEEGYSTHLITHHTVQFIEQHKTDPFSILVAHEAVHAPMQGPEYPIQRGPNKQPKSQKNPPEEAFRLMLQELDNSVGDIMAAVNKAGIAHKTLILFTSDNGPMKYASPGPLRGKKGSMFEGGHRVPAIAWWPNTIKANTVTEQTTISIDLVPTMLAMSGAKAPDNHRFDGVSLLPIFQNIPLASRKLFWRNGGLNGATLKEPIAKDTPKAMRDGQWKLVATPYYEKVSLFDLHSDLSEQHDLAEKFPQRVAAMTKELKTWEKEVMEYLPYTTIPEKR